MENMKFISGYIMATIGNFGWKKLNQQLTASDFFKLNNDVLPDEADLKEIMKQPEIKNRFKKDAE